MYKVIKYRMIQLMFYWLRNNFEYCYYKRYSKIDQYLARPFKYNVKCLSSPPLFLCSQIITPFYKSMISTNQETGF